MLKGLKARFACGTNLSHDRPGSQDQQIVIEARGMSESCSLVRVGDLFAVHSGCEKEDEGGRGDEQHGNVAVMDERVLRAERIGIRSREQIRWVERKQDEPTMEGRTNTE